MSNNLVLHLFIQKLCLFEPGLVRIIFECIFMHLTPHNKYGLNIHKIFEFFFSVQLDSNPFNELMKYVTVFTNYSILSHDYNLYLNNTYLTRPYEIFKMRSIDYILRGCLQYYSDNHDKHYDIVKRIIKTYKIDLDTIDNIMELMSEDNKKTLKIPRYKCFDIMVSKYDHLSDYEYYKYCINALNYNIEKLKNTLEVRRTLMEKKLLSLFV